MNILVTGANGQLGNEMRIIAKCSENKYIFTDVVEQEGVETSILDITDIEAIRKIVADHKINSIVNCAAYTNVDTAESNKTLAEKLNADAPENLAKAMKEVGLYRSLLIMSLVRSHITLLVGRNRQEPRLGFMESPNYTENRRSLLQAVSTSSFAQLGSTQSSERIFARLC